MELFGSKVRNEFLQEATVLINETANLLPILNNKNSLLIIFRNIQNLNGSCICAGFEDLGLVGHALEDLIYDIKIGGLEINDEINEAIKRVCENYKKHIQVLEIDENASLDIDADLKLLSSFFEKSQTEAEKQASNASKESSESWNPKTPKVLLIDDDSEVGQIVSKLLSENGFEIEYEDSPAELVKTSMKGFISASYDLVITDLRMPGVDGLEVIKKIRNIDLKVPIIVVSAFGEKEDLIELINLGVDSFVKKPFDANRLLRKVRHFVHMNVLYQGIEEISESNVRLNMAFERILFTIADLAEDLKIKDEMQQVEMGIKKIRRITHAVVQAQEEVMATHPK